MYRTCWAHKSGSCAGFAALALVCAASALASAPLNAPALLPGRPTRFSVGASHVRTFTLRLRKGEYVRVRIEQLHHLALVELERAGRPPEMRFRDTGRHGVIRISLVAQSDRTYRFLIRPYERRQPASGLIRVSRMRPASAAERRDASAEALYARAEWSRHRGGAASWPGAVKQYRRAAAAAAALGDVTLLRAALTGEARLELYQLNDYRAALPLARRAAALAGGGDVPGQALAWKTLASAQAYLARYRQCVSASRRALELFRKSGDRYWQGIVLGNLAYAYWAMGRTGLALRTARESLAMARSVHDWFGVEFNLVALGGFHSARGEFNQSFDDYRRALAALRAHPYPDAAALAWTNLGELFEQVNDPGEARTSLRKALRLAAAAHDSATGLEVLSDLGDLSLREGDAHAALAYDRKGISRATALGLPRETSYLLTGQGEAYAALEDGSAARASFDKAIALARKVSQRGSEASAWLALGDEELTAGRAVAAQAAYRRALALCSAESDRPGMARALASLARVERHRGELRAARAHIERALGLIGSTRSTLAARELRTAYFTSQHAYYDLGVSILMQLADRYPGHGYALQALHIAERGRARTLLDALQRAARLPAGLVSAHLARAMRRNRQQLDAAYDRWRDLIQEPNAANAQFTALRRRIETLERSGDVLEALARARNRRYAAVVDARPMSIARVRQRLLDAHTAILEYWIGAKRGEAWLVRDSGLSVLSMPPERVLARQVKALRDAITARTRSVAGESVAGRLARVDAADAQASRLAGVLGSEILPDARSLRGIRTLYVVADGPLFGVPFAALRPRGGTRALVFGLAVVREPSISVLSALARNSPRPPARPASVAVFADPVYTRNDPRFGALIAQTDTSADSAENVVRWAPEQHIEDLPRLIGAREEARAIRRLSEDHAEVRTGFAATVRAVRSTNWRHFAVAEFAVHTLLDAKQPQFSGLVLTLYHRDGRREQGVLWLRDIYSLDIPVGLVVLSSCRTLEGRDVPGEGLVGLYRAFLMAGAHAVLGSLWAVQDRPTGRFMTVFYRNLLRRGLSGARALRAAQLSFARSRRYSAAYYWAGFSIEGQGVRPG